MHSYYSTPDMADALSLAVMVVFAAVFSAGLVVGFLLGWALT